MKLIFTLLFALLLLGVQAQSAAIRGQLQDDDKSAIVFANVALYNAADSSLAKVEARRGRGRHFRI